MHPNKTIEEIAFMDGRYKPQAFHFVFEGLGHAVKITGMNPPGHISGQDLSYGLAGFAQNRWGRLSRMVLNQWGIYNTRDLGEIVYLMIEYKWMNAQDSDRIEDFDNVFDFETLFENDFVF